MKAIKTWKVLNDECMIRIHRKEDGTIYIKEYQNGELVCTECLEREYEAFLTTRIQEAVDNSYTRNVNVPAELIKLGFVEDKN